MQPIRTILHPTDFSDCSQATFRLACSLARDHGARLVVLHVTSLPDLAYQGYGAPGSAALPEEYLTKVRQDLELLQPPGPQVPMERCVVEGDPVSEILRAAKENVADLIVLGTHGKTGLPHVLMRSVAEQVVRKAACPVLTVKTPTVGRQPAPSRKSH